MYLLKYFYIFYLSFFIFEFSFHVSFCLSAPLYKWVGCQSKWFMEFIYIFIFHFGLHTQMPLYYVLTHFKLKFFGIWEGCNSYLSSIFSCFVSKMTNNSEKCSSHFPRGQTDVFRLLFLSNKQSETITYLH